MVLSICCVFDLFADSGEPAVVVVKCLELLGQAFGTTLNSKGFKQLPPFVRLIQVA